MKIVSGWLFMYKRGKTLNTFDETYQIDLPQPRYDQEISISQIIKEFRKTKLLILIPLIPWSWRRDYTTDGSASLKNWSAKEKGKFVYTLLNIAFTK